MSTLTRIHYAFLQSIGHREEQQDAVGAVTAEGGVLEFAIVADGMGGHSGGKIASELAKNAFTGSLQNSVRASRTQRLRAGLDEANGAIADRVKQEPGYEGMGTTLIAAAFADDGFHWISVGDSPIYLIRRGEIRRINEDHSMTPILEGLVASGQLTQHDADTDPRRSVLRSAVSGASIELIDRSQQLTAFGPGDILILATDGLDTLTDSEVHQICEAHRSHPDALAQSLLQEVENRNVNGQDNTTVFIVLHEDDDHDASPLRVDSTLIIPANDALQRSSSRPPGPIAAKRALIWVSTALLICAAVLLAQFFLGSDKPPEQASGDVNEPAQFEEVIPPPSEDAPPKPGDESEPEDNDDDAPTTNPKID